MPATCLRLPSADVTPVPLSCPPSEPPCAEYTANGHYAEGPQLAQPTGLVKMIADAIVPEPPDVQRAAAAKQIAADRTAYRRQLPIPELAASTRALRRHGLGRAGVRAVRGMPALIAALRKAA